jgi:hypothetical protein
LLVGFLKNFQEAFNKMADFKGDNRSGLSAKSFLDLKKKVLYLETIHPPNPNAFAPQTRKQISWICTQLQAAANAMETGRDYLGNPITHEQIKDGMKKLIEIVTDQKYLTTMEIVYFDISNPLESLMNELLELIEPPREVATYSKGVETLVELWAPGRNIFLPHNSDYKRIAEELNEEGKSGSRALVALIGDLLACRSREITYALRVAEHVNPTPELIDVVSAVANASGLTAVPDRSPFTPEIVGGGQVGWTDGTHRLVVDLAQDLLHKYTEPEISEVISRTDVKHYRIDFENGTIPIGDLPIGARVVDPSWAWEFRTGKNYTGSGEVKPVSWIIVAKDHYDGLEPHITLLAEGLIGRHTIDNSTDRGHEGAEYGYNHWGESGTANATHGLRPWLNSSGIHSGEGFYRVFSDKFKGAALTTNVPNKEWKNGSAYSTEDKVFLPSTTELGDTAHMNTYQIGTAYAYFTDAGDTKRVAHFAGENWWYWTRSPYSRGGTAVRTVSRGGNVTRAGWFYTDGAADGYGSVLPALNLKSEILVSEIKK